MSRQEALDVLARRGQSGRRSPLRGHRPEHRGKAALRERFYAFNLEDLLP